MTEIVSGEENLKKYAEEIFYRENIGFDAGGFKEALCNYIGWDTVLEYDELILTNDSVFGPLYDLKEFIESIEKDKEWDLCGINTAYDFHTWHLSSYFLVFRKNGFLSETFKEHINSIKKENSVKKVSMPI